MKDDDRLICNRFLEYAENCYQRDIPVITDFLDLHKQTLFHTVLHKMPPVSWKATGGYDLAERKVLIFLPYEDYPQPESLKAIEISPLSGKFAPDLSHRDYMGSIMNLGVVRDKIGDIVIDQQKAYVFATLGIADYLMEHLLRVKHTPVHAKILEPTVLNLAPEFKEIKGTVASLRLDAVISLGFNSSRSQLITYIEDGLTAVNGQIITSNGYQLRPDDIISVRGLGKIRFIQSICETKKGRQMVIIHKYI